jgi:hypothetical protein
MQNTKERGGCRALCFNILIKASLCSVAGRYDNPIPNRFLAPIDCYNIPAQVMVKEVKLLKQKVTETWKRLEAERVRERTRDRDFGQETVTKVSIKEAERIYDRNVGGRKWLVWEPGG